MSIITKMLSQKAVYWPLASEETGGQAVDDYGQLVYGQPVEIDCRWDDEMVEVLDVQGNVFVSKAKVCVDRDVLLGGVLMLGVLDDVADLDNPKKNEGAFEVKAFLKNPNFRATEFLRMAVL